MNLNHATTSYLWRTGILILVLLYPFFGLSQTESYKQVSSIESHIHAVVDDILKNCKTTATLTESDFADLPIGISPSGCNSTTTILVVDSAYRAERGGWFFSIYASVILPGTSKPIAFSASNLNFNKGGLTSSNARLMLVSEHSVPISDNIRLDLPADGRNFIEFDCNGFKSINLKGNFVFSDSFLEPDPKRAPGKKEVTASFEINTADLNNILMAVNITPFKISGLSDLSFEIRNAVADFSDIVNPPGFSFPPDYQQTFGGDIQLWRGFYLQEASIRLDGLADSTAGRDLTIQARNLLIDDLGVSGWFTASNLLSLQEGSADGWPISIDQLSVKLMFNKLAGGSLSGSLNIPLLGKEPIAYKAQMEQVGREVNYLFAITTPSSKEFDTPFSAKIRIAEGSTIALLKQNGKLIPSALLHGDITVDNKAAKFSGIRFENLGLTTAKPYITSGVFSTVSNKDSDRQGKTAGFPVRIDSVNLRVFQGEAAIGFAVALNLMNKEGKGFSAETFVQVLAKMEERTQAPPVSETPQPVQKRQEWVFKKVQINDIKLEVNTMAIGLKGILRIFDDHPTYGNGFMGSLDFKINKIMNNPAKVTAYFGSKETYRYWHLDAYVPTKIPIPPAISINGLMGGASYHMVRQQPFQPDFNEIDPEKMKANAAIEKEVVYIPDEKSGLSFLAGITLVVGNENAINADALLEINFNEHGGMRYAQFTGSAFFFTSIKERGRTTGGNAPKAPVLANLNMVFDNDNNVFHANLKTYINVAGLIRGVGPNNLVGEAVIHTDPKDWYVYIGRPSQMFGLEIARLAVAKTYFMIGTKVENLPLPPPEVREVFNDIDEGLMRDGTALARGRGFALGAHFRIGFDEKFGPFYAAFAVGAGTDVMLRDYGDAYCEGRTGKIGIDGWYASGQAYVFLKGRVGIRVRGAKFDILNLGAAALLQAKLPNPAWMKGRLGGRYSILGGLVKGKFNIKFTIGEKCEIIEQGSELSNIQVIADLKPDLDAKDVNVFTAPQASFNTSVDSDFTMMDAQDNVITYRIRLAEFVLTKNNTPIQASIEWNAMKDVAILRTFEILPPQSTLKATVKLFWEKKGTTGGWETIKVNNEILYEVKETTFTTGLAPDFIPDENVAFSYPVKNQYNLHVNETGQGYVQLRVGQAYLFEQPSTGTAWTFSAKFQDTKGSVLEVPLVYNIGEKKAAFDIPQGLSKQTIYKFYFVKRPLSTGPIDQNVLRNEVSVNTGDENETTINSNTLEGTITQNVDKDLYTSAFRTSQFATFADKWATFTNQQDQYDIATGNIAVIGKRGSINETFDEIDLRGKEGQIKPLVQVIASPETNWMKDYIAPMLYNQYPVDKDVVLSWRDPQILGVKPLKGVKLTNDQGEYRLTDTNISTGSAPNKSGTILFGYYLSWYGYKDFNDLRNQAAAKYLNNWGGASQGVKNLLSAGGFVDLIQGDYPVEVTYTLPGSNQPTYRNQVSIKF